MSGQEALEKAIRKAIAGGWKRAKKFAVVDNGPTIELWEGKNTAPFIYVPEQIIFSHPFAKALWGEGDKLFDATETIQAAVNIGGGRVLVPKPIPSWQYHLQMMVISKDPLKYLGDHLPD